MGLRSAASVWRRKPTWSWRLALKSSEALSFHQVTHEDGSVIRSKQRCNLYIFI